MTLEELKLNFEAAIKKVRDEPKRHERLIYVSFTEYQRRERALDRAFAAGEEDSVMRSIAHGLIPPEYDDPKTNGQP